MITKYVAAFKQHKVEWAIHYDEILAKTGLSYKVGDIVALKSYGLSSAGYGIIRKFLPRYVGQYTVIGDMGNNLYRLVNVDNINQLLTANIRQLVLVRRGG